MNKEQVLKSSPWLKGLKVGDTVAVFCEQYKVPGGCKWKYSDTHGVLVADNNELGFSLLYKGVKVRPTAYQLKKI